MPRYQNPPDYLIKMAQCPEKVSATLDLEIMIEKYNHVLRPQIEQELSKKISDYSGVYTNFDALAQGRQANFFMQVWQVFKRNM
jgi:hypothetical protein